MFAEHLRLPMETKGMITGIVKESGRLVSDPSVLMAQLIALGSTRIIGTSGDFELM